MEGLDLCVRTPSRWVEGARRGFRNLGWVVAGGERPQPWWISLGRSTLLIRLNFLTITAFFSMAPLGPRALGAGAHGKQVVTALGRLWWTGNCHDGGVHPYWATTPCTGGVWHHSGSTCHRSRFFAIRGMLKDPLGSPGSWTKLRVSKEAAFVSRMSEHPCLLCSPGPWKARLLTGADDDQAVIKGPDFSVAGLEGFESELQDPDCEKDLLISKEGGSGFLRGLLGTF